MLSAVVTATELVTGEQMDGNNCAWSILPSHGGRSRDQKRKLYQRAGVREYITIGIFGKRIVWRILADEVYVAQTLSLDGIDHQQFAARPAVAQ